MCLVIMGSGISEMGTWTQALQKPRIYPMYFSTFH